MIRDYSTYSLADLKASLAVVDARKHPENKAAIEAELQRRIDSGEAEREEAAMQSRQASEDHDYAESARKGLKVLGWVLMVASVYMLGSWIYAFVQSGSTHGLLLGMILIAIAAFSLIAGWGLVKSTAWSHTTALLALSAQVVSIHSEWFSYQNALLPSVYLTHGNDIAIGLYAEFVPIMGMQIGGSSGFVIGINIVALSLIGCLFVAREQTSTNSP